MRLLAAVLLVTAATAIAALSPYKPLPKEEESCRLGEWTGVIDQMEVHMPGCPEDARSLVDRALQCQHWMGEEPYDAARGHEIEVAIDELGCAKLADEHRIMLDKYKGRPDVIGTLEAADREYSIEF